MSAVLDANRLAAATAGSDVFVRFGPDEQLLGVLSGPAGAGPVLLLPSAGLQPRSGPFRLHWNLAQRLAAAGMRSFRYDIPGVGEAPRLPGCDATQATIAAIDRLEAMHGCRTFAIGGICSAADIGWDVAVNDRRVVALLLLDGICFRGPWYRYARLLGLLKRLPKEWMHFARKASGRLRRGNASLDSNAFRTWPGQAEARVQFAQMVARDMQLLWIFSGGYEDRFLHPRQFQWSFGSPAIDPRVTMHHWPDCDHTYFGRAQRERLLASVVEWMAALPGWQRP
ncbi:alpha/beta hydrolase family protein [Lysobacter tyrosinilyticus]